MRRLLPALLALAVAASPSLAQRRGAPPPAITRAALDSFVTTVRDMAAAAIVTPAAHIPVGGVLDSTGNVASITAPNTTGATTPDDSMLTAFRSAMGFAAQQMKSGTVGFAYLVRRPTPGAGKAVDAVLVEVESAPSFRANLLFPYTRNEFGEPVFGESHVLPGAAEPMLPRRGATRARGRRP